MRSKWSDNIMKFFSLWLLLIRPHYLRQYVRSIIRDDRPMSPAHYMAEYVHIWYILCAPVRDFACAFVCTLATAKQYTKERRTITAEKQNFLCVLCRGESHARALQLPLLLSLPLPLPLFLLSLIHI